MHWLLSIIKSYRNAIDLRFGMFPLILACFLARLSYEKLDKRLLLSYITINITSGIVWEIMGSVESDHKD